MSDNVGQIVGINGNLITVRFAKPVTQSEVGYARTADIALKAEVIRIRGENAELQVFEDTTGLKVGDPVEFSGNLLAVELGPGLLAQVYDGLQNPLPKLAEQCGFFLPRGTALTALARATKWAYTPTARKGDEVTAGDTLGTVPEGIFEHRIMVPFRLAGKWKVAETVAAGSYDVDQVVAKLRNERGDEVAAKMVQEWPVKVPIKAYAERLRPVDPLVTKVRIIDTFFPVARGGVLLYESEGQCPGVICGAPRGTHGFGYDPVFLLPDLGKTLAELTDAEKNRLSHRARAVAALLRQLL